MAVHVHANKVETQPETMSHKVLVLQDGESLASSVRIWVLLRPGSEAQTNGMQKRIAQSGRAIVKSRA
jgi:hypothetical protein